ncbi:asparagine synthase (glutamine-hydrolyzing) [bacterium]|nr:asparagine synthase (glutamine-hydrolyzing) [bacterium]NUN46084.1 asparagine synthase (glutamine-hydrolyzing) [bacterium]
MCGITGYIHHDINREACQKKLKRMSDTLFHRGPDGEGFFVNKNIALGHRRLSIIDLKTGGQPVFSADRRLCLIFNGEIYNYLELKDELKKLGHTFKTTSDTEVALCAYQQWGIDCLQHFNGMWSFALWDGYKQRLFCARDRVGEKPFFYTLADESFIFGSEIKAVLAYGLKKRINREVLDAYLCFTYIPAPQTFFQGIYKLPAAHYLLYESGKITINPYWDLTLLDDKDARDDEIAILKEFDDIFNDSVKIRMRSDVPFGAFLSGGMDSSSVVAVMSQNSTVPITTCTIGYNDSRFDERYLARLVADKFRTSHNEYVVEPDDVEILIKKLAFCYDEPFGDTSAIPTYAVSKMARSKVTMVLTGDGGDEVLNGYTIHQGEKFSNIYQSFPHYFQHSFEFLFNFSSQVVFPEKLNKNIKRYKKIIASARMGFVDRLISKQIGFTQHERNIIFNGDKTVRPAREYIEDTLRPVMHLSSFNQLNYWLIKVALSDDMLTKVDRASMAHSLETRLPFLDHRLIELTSTVKSSIKLNGFRRKEILRKTTGQLLPKQLLNQKKRGFSVPDSERFWGLSMRALYDKISVLDQSHLIFQNEIGPLIHSLDQTNISTKVWLLAMLSSTSE